MSGDTYSAPDHGWTCFHCGEHFPPHGLGIERAKEHFGDYQHATPACQLWGNSKSWFSALRKVVRALRAAEKERDEVRHQLSEEDTEKDRQISRLISEHRAALMREEEKGYGRGLADGRKLRSDAL